VVVLDLSRDLLRRPPLPLYAGIHGGEVGAAHPVVGVPAMRRKEEKKKRRKEEIEGAGGGGEGTPMVSGTNGIEHKSCTACTYGT
jgi:hypothetical protein